MLEHSSLHLGQGVKRFLIRVGGAFAVGALILAGSINSSAALEKKTVADGLAACEKWCEANNKTSESLKRCYEQCRKYWYCNGSDANTPQNKGACRIAGGVTGTLTQNPQTKFGPAKTNPQGVLKKK